ncbi:MBL fold metallo-hydrolase [bacterium]|nr:MAG: MBL fold metallo-hydrolase [bacterium]
MRIKIFTVNPFSENSYLYYDDISGDGILIDPGFSNASEEKQLDDFVISNNIHMKYIINTHGHIDHMLGNSYAKEKYACPLLIHEQDVFLLNKAPEQGRMFGVDVKPSPPPDDYITDSTKIELNGTLLEFIHTPGHSPGGICIIDKSNKTVFTGDLIFLQSVGRTDLPGGDFEILMDSIMNKLFGICSDDFVLYPGHMEQTTVKNEKRFNPFLQKD